MADEQLDFWGGLNAVGPAAVPPVVFLWPASRRRIPPDRQFRRRQLCGHCVMVRHAIEGGELFAGWSRGDLACFHPLEAIFTITQTDGSTLDLCGQHAQEHEERGERHG